MKLPLRIAVICIKIIGTIHGVRAFMHRGDSPKPSPHITSGSLLVIALCFSVAPPVDAQTAIVAARTPEKIVIGADSRGIVGGDKSKIRSICKIRQTGRIFYAASGLAEVPETGFNVWDIVSEAFQRPNTFEEKIEAFEQSVKAPLSKALHYIRTVNPTDYRQKFDTRDKVALQIVFAVVESGVTRILIRDFQIATPDPISFNIYRRSCPGTCSTGSSVYFLGRKEAMLAYDAANPQIWPSKIETAVDTLIRIAIADQSDEVGLPIDILRITHEGAKWIQNEKKCPEIQNTVE